MIAKSTLLPAGGRILLLNNPKLGGGVESALKKNVYLCSVNLKRDVLNKISVRELNKFYKLYFIFTN